MCLSIKEPYLIFLKNIPKLLSPAPFYEELPMKYFQVARPTMMGIAAASVLALSAFSSFATADELNFKLFGDMEVPPVKTIAQGNADITINKDMTVSGKVMTYGITGTMAHIHNGKAGSNGPVIVTLTKNGDNCWMVPAGAKLSETEFKAFMADASIGTLLRSMPHRLIKN
jgi:hypothetical protein